ncbi:MAG: hypothetical protein HQL72_15550 [Magnetococcales bacterium]|nr:hypothetical protein [Magnetococcales bacterium]
MDAILVKILNMVTSGSYEESSIAVEQAYRYMKKNGKSLDDVNFNALYNGDVVAIKLIARFAHDYQSQKDQSRYISSWAKTVYGLRGERDDQQDQHVALIRNKNQRLERELDHTKRELEKLRESFAVSEQFHSEENLRLKGEQEEMEQYLNEVKEKHNALIAALGEYQERAKHEADRSQQKIRVLEESLRNIQNNNSKNSEMYEYQMHAKELQITTIKREVKILLSNLRQSCQPSLFNTAH